jgi:hypothetical protein
MLVLQTKFEPKFKILADLKKQGPAQVWTLTSWAVDLVHVSECNEY